MIINMRISNMALTSLECTLVFSDILKHSWEDFKDDPITFRPYPHNPSLCPVKTMKDYMYMRTSKSGYDEVFIISVRHHTPAHHDTIANWIEHILACTLQDRATPVCRIDDLITELIDTVLAKFIGTKAAGPSLLSPSPSCSPSAPSPSPLFASAPTVSVSPAPCFSVSCGCSSRVHRRLASLCFCVFSSPSWAAWPKHVLRELCAFP